MTIPRGLGLASPNNDILKSGTANYSMEGLSFLLPTVPPIPSDRTDTIKALQQLVPCQFDNRRLALVELYKLHIRQINKLCTAQKSI
jgi:hypothetical protein